VTHYKFRVLRVRKGGTSRLVKKARPEIGAGDKEGGKELKKFMWVVYSFSGGESLRPRPRPGSKAGRDPPGGGGDSGAARECERKTYG